MRLAAGRTKGFDLVIERLPVAGQHVSARDNDIDLRCSGLDRSCDLAKLLLKWVLSGGETGRDGGNRNSGTTQRLNRRRHQVMIDTDRTNLEIKTPYTHRIQEFLTHRITRFSTETAHIAGRIVTCQCSEIQAGDSAQEPRSLPLLFDGAARRQRGGTALDGAAIHPYPVNPVQV